MWTKDWTVENVEQNFLVLGKAGIDPDDIVQLIEDSKQLAKLRRDGVVISRGEKEKLDEFKRRVAENRR